MISQMFTVTTQDAVFHDPWAPIPNIGILRMTGEVTDRFNEIILFGIALFWQEATEFFTKFIIHFLTE